MTATDTRPTAPPRRSLLDRATAMRLAATEYGRYLDQLRTLDAADWGRPTDCSGWDVRAMAGHCLGMAEFAASLPIAGRTGTLHDRMRRNAARDNCRAKTGTLSNVSALAGYCEARDGGRVAFAFLMNGVWPSSARRLQDRMAGALARYDG